jgi:hypothetical protein
MRIRSVKPDFYRDEKLSDLENEYPELRPMLVFSGLWGVSDKHGVFPWNPRTLRLDILPLVVFDIEMTLKLLESAQIVRRFEHDGKIYGHVVNFERHQRINGSEATDESKFPKPKQYIEIGEGLEKIEVRFGSSKEAVGKQQGSSRDDRKGREGKGRDLLRRRQFSSTLPQDATAAPDGAPEDVVLFPSAEESKELDLYHAVEKAFLSKNDDRFTNYGKEGKAIKELIKKARARAPDNPEAFLTQMIAAFWRLKCSGDKFYSGQPYLPSALNASGIWDRVLESLRNVEAMADPTAMAIARGEII